MKKWDKVAQTRISTSPEPVTFWLTWLSLKFSWKVVFFVPKGCLVFEFIFSTQDEAPSSLFTKRQRQSALRNILTEGGVDQAVIEKFCQSDLVAGALWHIWPPRHTAKIRSILKKLDKSNQYKKSSGNDPIHDQDTYITGELREKLEEHGIYAQAIIQCAGDCVFIPQVRIKLGSKYGYQFIFRVLSIKYWILIRVSKSPSISFHRSACETPLKQPTNSEDSRPRTRIAKINSNSRLICIIQELGLY